jgi:hypothetical protein
MVLPFQVQGSEPGSVLATPAVPAPTLACRLGVGLFRRNGDILKWELRIKFLELCGRLEVPGAASGAGQQR